MRQVKGVPMEKFSKRLKMLRIERDLKQHDMALYLKLSDGGYRCYEQGRGFPDVPKLCALADFFDVSLDYLMGRSETRERMP